MQKQEFKNTVYQEIANVGKALSNPYRLRILNLLAQNDYSVEEISDDIGISIANTSQHLQVLKKHRLLKTNKKGHYVIYSLKNERVFNLWNSLQNYCLESSLEIKETIKEFKQENFINVDSISAKNMQVDQRFIDACFLDVRPKEEYEKLAISNAISIPVGELERKLSVLPTDKLIIVYCRGGLCLYADEAVTFLVKKGYQAIRLEEEVLEWKKMGFSVN